MWCVNLRGYVWWRDNIYTRHRPGRVNSAETCLPFIGDCLSLCGRFDTVTRICEIILGMPERYKDARRSSGTWMEPDWILALEAIRTLTKAASQRLQYSSHQHEPIITL
jgi:hypothetical protein